LNYNTAPCPIQNKRGSVSQMFTLTGTTSPGRRGVLSTPHGEIQTPFFMPVGTAGAMRGITHEDLLSLGAQILLCNTYHMHLQPGEEIVREAGGLHEFIHWSKPILTDSGGYQVFSLRGSNSIEDHGVHFRSHINGDPLFLGPESAIRIQHALGADIIMCFDHCPPSTAARAEIEQAVDRTLRWAQECKTWHREYSTGKENPPMLFGIVQGGLEPDLRKKCAEELIAMDFDGYAIGGLAVGESPQEMYDVVDAVCPLLPEEKLRYLMGVGVADQLKKCVAKGVDMFDCVLPMRLARHGHILLADGTDIRIRNTEYKSAHIPIDPLSPSALSRTHTRSYLHHLVRANERLGETIACMQNMGITLQTMQRMRAAMDEEI